MVTMSDGSDFEPSGGEESDFEPSDVELVMLPVAWPCLQHCLTVAPPQLTKSIRLMCVCTLCWSVAGAGG